MRIKGAAALVERGARATSTRGSPTQIAAASTAIAAGEHDNQFPIDVFQTGSGTSSNMNADGDLVAGGKAASQ